MAFVGVGASQECLDRFSLRKTPRLLELPLRHSFRKAAKSV
jgi:hypothetical protein